MSSKWSLYENESVIRLQKQIQRAFFTTPFALVTAEKKDFYYRSQEFFLYES